MRRLLLLVAMATGLAAADPLPPHQWKLMQWLPPGPPELRRQVAQWEGISLDTPMPSMRVDQDDVKLITRSRSAAMAWASFGLPKGTWSVSFDARIDRPSGQLSVNLGQDHEMVGLTTEWQHVSLASAFPYRTDTAGLYVRATTLGTTELRGWQVVRTPYAAPASEPATVPEVRLLHPSYRQTLFAFDADRQVRVEVHRSSAASVSLAADGGQVVQVSPPLANGEVAFDVTALAPGLYHVMCGPLDIPLYLAPSVPDVVDVRQGEVRRNGQPWFPLGIYPQGGPPDLAPPGIDVACINLDRQPISGALSQGFIIFRMAPGGAGLSDFLQRLVAQGTGHRVVAWSALDEPDMTPRGALLEPAYRILWGLDPFHPVYTAIHSSGAFEGLAGGADILAADPYPISTVEPPIWLVATAMDRARAAAGPDRSVWLVNQAFGLYPFWQRAPSPAEERCMAWLAINHGARGLIYYAQEEILWPGSPDLKWHLQKTPLYGAITELDAQVRLAEPVLLSQEPVATPATLLDDDGSLDVATWTLNGDTYVSVVNVTQAAVPARVHVPGAATQATDLFSAREWSVSNGTFTADMPPLGARFFRLAP